MSVPGSRRSQEETWRSDAITLTHRKKNKTTHTHTHARTHARKHTHTHSLSLSHTHTHTHTLFFSQTHTHTHTHRLTWLFLRCSVSGVCLKLCDARPPLRFIRAVTLGSVRHDFTTGCSGSTKSTNGSVVVNFSFGGHRRA